MSLIIITSSKTVFMQQNNQISKVGNCRGTLLLKTARHLKETKKCCFFLYYKDILSVSLLKRVGCTLPLLSSSVSEVCVCPAGTGWIHGRRRQLLERGFGAAAQQTALLGLSKAEIIYWKTCSIEFQV